MMKKKIMSWLVVLTLIITTALPIYATTTQDKISEAQQNKEGTESNLANTRQELSELETQKAALEQQVSTYNEKVSALTAELESLNAEVAQNQQSLEATAAALEQAKAEEEEQYENMKLRISYMYENADSSFSWTLLFSSDDFAEFLNRAENVIQISTYDRNMLKVYQAAKEEVQQQESALKEQEETLIQSKANTDAKVEEVQNLISSTYTTIQEYSADITEGQAQEAALLSTVSQQEEALNQLLKQAADEAVAQKTAIAQAEQAASAAAASTAQAAAQTASTEAADTSVSQPVAAPETVADTGAGESSSQGTYLGTFRLTAYCPCAICCGSWAGGNTASGTTPTAGRTVAMGGVPFGTKLLINGVVYTVEDRGTAYGHVDIFHNTHAEALQFGSQYAEVYQVS
ncbi:MAG: hypothetical protein ACK5MN_01165 [Lachnospiraceae bacterium]